MSDMATHRGAAASPGIGMGPAYVIQSEEPPIPAVDDPQAAFVTAAATATQQLTDLAAKAESSGLEEAAEILRAQAMMADDPMFAEEVGTRLNEGDELGPAVIAAAELIGESLRNSGSDYLAERAADVGEIAKRIRYALAGVVPTGLAQLAEASIIVAPMLTAADTAGMRPEFVRGFVTEQGGPTGHVAVIARALGIPAAVAVADACRAVVSGETVIVDGGTGTVVLRPDAKTSEQYSAKAADHARMLETAQKYRGVSISVGDRAMSIAANVGGPEDIAAAASEGADGIGLFRTEFLFLEQAKPPSEDEQVAAYREALEAFDKPVVIRTFDIGGDKPASYLEIEPEENPFLGVRGMRLYRDERALALTQARAMLRAAPSGDLWVMAPMVTTIGDAVLMRELFDEAQETLDAAGVAYGSVKLGVMVEVPAAALNAVALTKYVDFFSIGTNDLTQYTLAVDRMSAPLASYMDAAEPAVLRLCAMTAKAANDAGLSVSVCGEAGSDPGLALLFAAMGMDKLSVTSLAVNRIKQVLAEVDTATLAPLLEKCLAAGSAEEVRELLASASG